MVVFVSRHVMGLWYPPNIGASGYAIGFARETNFMPLHWSVLVLEGLIWPCPSPPQFRLCWQYALTMLHSLPRIHTWPDSNSIVQSGIFRDTSGDGLDVSLFSYTWQNHPGKLTSMPEYIPRISPFWYARMLFVRSLDRTSLLRQQKLPIPLWMSSFLGHPDASGSGCNHRIRQGSYIPRVWIRHQVPRL